LGYMGWPESTQVNPKSFLKNIWGFNITYKKN
jgi:hypothetical protein